MGTAKYKEGTDNIFLNNNILIIFKYLIQIQYKRQIFAVNTLSLYLFVQKLLLLDITRSQIRAFQIVSQDCRVLLTVISGGFVSLFNNI